MIRIRDTGALVTESQFKAMHSSASTPESPTTTFPDGALSAETIMDLGADPVFEGPQPTPQSWQVVAPDGAHMVDGQWFTKWKLVPNPDCPDEETWTARRHEQIKAHISAAVQARLDSFAQTRGYDGIMSAASYAASTNSTFATEGAYALEARDLTWAKLYEMLAEVLDGTRPVPDGYADIEQELPPLAWPV